MQVQIPGDRGQQNLESEDKNCASYNWSIRDNQEVIGRNLKLLAGHPSAVELQKIALMSTANIIR